MIRFLLGLIILIFATIQGSLETDIHGYVINPITVIGGMVIAYIMMHPGFDKFLNQIYKEIFPNDA